MLSNALMADAKCLDNPSFEPLRKFMDAMQNLDGLKQYLENRPDLVGIGSMPSLVDKNGTKCNQMLPGGSAFITDDLTFLHEVSIQKQ